MSMILGALEASDQSKPCLVIVDELGRGTSPDEGIGIAHAIAEEIIKSKAICFFATHFKVSRDLSTLERTPFELIRNCRCRNSLRLFLAFPMSFLFTSRQKFVSPFTLRLIRPHDTNVKSLTTDRSFATRLQLDVPPHSPRRNDSSRSLRYALCLSTTLPRCPYTDRSRIR